MNEETQADIIREMRDLGALDEKSVDMIPRRLQALGLRTYADRIEAARKRESGNAAAMRAALSDACYAMFNFLKTQSGGYEEMAIALDKARAALAAPPRNCDVGPAEEQARRFQLFCQNHRGFDAECSTRCPFVNTADINHCQSGWAQLPYEGGRDAIS